MVAIISENRQLDTKAPPKGAPKTQGQLPRNGTERHVADVDDRAGVRKYFPHREHDAIGRGSGRRKLHDIAELG